MDKLESISQPDKPKLTDKKPAPKDLLRVVKDLKRVDSKFWDNTHFLRQHSETVIIKGLRSKNIFEKISTVGYLNRIMQIIHKNEANLSDHTRGIGYALAKNPELLSELASDNSPKMIRNQVRKIIAYTLEAWGEVEIYDENDQLYPLANKLIGYAEKDLESNLKYFDKQMNSDGLFLIPLLKFGSEITKTRILNRMTQYANSHPDKGNDKLTSLLKQINIHHYQVEAQKIVELELMNYTSEWKSIMKNWPTQIIPENGFRGEISLNKRYVDNIKFIQSLEKKRKGIVSYLHEHNGISNFSNFPEDVLIDFYDNRENLRDNYVLSIQSKTDNNGALHKGRVTKSVFSKLKRYNQHIDPVETSNIIDLIEKMTKFSEKYGKISNIFISAHGETDKIILGEDDKEAINSINKKTFTGEALQKFNQSLGEKVNIILDSCSTGALEGIGQFLSTIDKNKKIKVIGPEFPASIDTIRIKQKANKLEWGVNYLKPIIAREYLQLIANNPGKFFDKVAKTYESGLAT